MNFDPIIWFQRLLISLIWITLNLAKNVFNLVKIFWIFLRILKRIYGNICLLQFSKLLSPFFSWGLIIYNCRRYSMTVSTCWSDAISFVITVWGLFKNLIERFNLTEFSLPQLHTRFYHLVQFDWLIKISIIYLFIIRIIFMYILK